MLYDHSDKLKRMTSTTLILLNDWPALRKAALQELQPVLPEGQQPEDAPDTLELNDVPHLLSGPMTACFTMHIHAYLIIKRMQFYLLMKNDNNMIDIKRENPAEPPTLATKKLDIFATHKEPSDAVLNRFKPVDLEKKLKELDGLFKEDIKQWEAMYKKTYQNCLDALEQQGYELNILQITQFQADEASTEIHKIFVDLKLTKSKISLPRYFASYCRDKLILVLHHELGRKQQANDMKSIEKKIKAFEPVLKKIREEETTLLNAQEKTLASAVQGFQYDA
jgi:hypothetical protein